MQSDRDNPEQIVTAANVDLSNCDRELVHMPGLIQPHGVMLVVNPSDLAVLQASENTATLFGVAASQLASRGIAGLLGEGQAGVLAAALADAGERLTHGVQHVLEIPPGAGRDGFDVLAHRAGDVLLVELEYRPTAVRQLSDPLADLADCMAQLQGASCMAAFLDAAVAQFRRFTGFDRVMAYEFADDGSGEVVAESKRDDLNAYLGQHFPSSDIPAPARRLLGLSWLRHLPNVEYRPVPLLPHTDQPVDMSRAILRHVSVMYTSYLKNIRAHATMVLPLMNNGRLWGLISCMHHAEPLHVPCRVRTAVELLAHMISALMAEQEARDTTNYRGRLQDAIAVLNQQMRQGSDYRAGLLHGDRTLHGWLDSTGAALVTQEGAMLIGETPTEQQIRSLIPFIEQNDSCNPITVTDRLSQLYPAAQHFSGTASGLLAVRLMHDRSDYVMWFRPELVQTVKWAGDPNKPVQIDVVDGEARLTPRSSFALWQEEIRGRSAPWIACEIEAATMLRQAIAEVVLIRLNQALQQSNAELDSFAYVASHDLKEPLRGIHNFALFLEESATAKLNEEERGRIQTILRLTQRMDDLTDTLLLYSRIGRTEFVLEPVDMNVLLRDVLDQLGARIIATGTEIRVPQPLPHIATDPVRLMEVFTNLIVNAIKYNTHPPGERWVEIGHQAENGRGLFYVRDNGIGIPKQHLEAVFQIFRRLHGRHRFGGGNGAGLTIARRTVERLGGCLWAESEGTDTGTTFWFSLGAVN
jgi:two-component system, chemotaxis family, sensor kinase Cph1